MDGKPHSDAIILELLKMEKSYAYHNSHSYNPVLVFITSETLQLFYGGQYLLQIWSVSGHKVYEKVLKSKAKELIHN